MSGRQAERHGSAHHENASVDVMSGGGISRRQLLRAFGLAASYALIGCQMPGNLASGAGNRRLGCFNLREGKTIEDLANIVLPSRSASEFDAVEFIDREVGPSSDLDLFRRGLRRLDDIAKRLFGKEFGLLDWMRQRILLESIFDNSKDSSIAKMDPGGVGRTFFQRFRFHAFRGFYSSEAGWEVTGYKSSPQGGATGELAPVITGVKSDEDCDVCIVGSGAGGSVVAFELARVGMQVVMLERGREYRVPEDYPGTKNRFEIEKNPLWASTSRYPVVGSRQALDQKYLGLMPVFGDTALPTLRDRKALENQRRRQELQMVFGVGGTTLVSEAQCTRYGNETFRERSIDGVGSDWPISYEEVEADYHAIEEILGVSGDPTLPGPPRKNEYPNPPHLLSKASTLVANGCKKMGLRLYPQATSALSRPYRGRPACRECGCCMLGCAYGAKGTADVCFISPALKTGSLRLLTNARCLRLEAGTDSQIAGLLYQDRGGSENRIRAKVYVLAAGAVETPRVLLMSACSRWPHGASNSAGRVGRNYQETLVAVSWGLAGQPVSSHQGLAVDNVILDYANTREKAGYARGFTVSSCAAGMNLLGPVSYALQLAPGWGGKHELFMRENFGNALVLQAAGEQLPSNYNRVELDPEKKECGGIPGVRVENRLGENDLLMVNSMVARLREILDACGAGEIHHNNSSFISRMGVEPRGTCRMGAEPRESVVDANCRSHDIKNLYIADAGVLVGGMHGNISLTIQALARRAARDIIKRMAGRDF